MRKPLNKMSVRVEDIHFDVACPQCGKKYGVQAKKPFFLKNVSCQHGTFYITITPMRGVVEIQVRFQSTDNQVQNVEPTDVEISGE